MKIKYLRQISNLEQKLNLIDSYIFYRKNEKQNIKLKKMLQSFPGLLKRS